MLADFARSHHIVMPDLLGFGRSSSPGQDASLDHQAAAIVAMLDALRLERVDVVGMSYGGLLAYLLAGLHPERVRRLVIVASPGHAWSMEDQRALLQRLGALRTSDVFVPTTAAGIRTLMELAWSRPTRVPDWAARQAITALYDPHRADQIALLEHLERDIEGLAGRAVRPQAPALVVWGAHDAVFPIAVGRRIAQDLDAELVVIEGARHMPNAEQPRRFNAIVLRFLAD